MITNNYAMRAFNHIQMVRSLEEHKKVILTILAVWVAIAIGFNIPSMDWTIGPFHSSDGTLVLPSIYGFVCNAIIYFGNVYVLMPMVLKKGAPQAYLRYLLVWFGAIMAIETGLDIVVYYVFHLQLNRLILEDILMTNLLLNTFFILVPSFLHRMVIDWFGTHSEDTENEVDSTLLLKSGTETHLVKTSSIDFIESDGNYIKYHVDGKVIMVRGTLGEVISELPEKQFVRCHKSYVVRLSAIEKVSYNSVDVKGIPVPVGRVYKSELNTLLHR